MRYFNFLSNFTDSFLYGLLLMVVTMSILYFVLQMVSKTCVKTWPFYLIGCVLAPLLLVQDSLLVAAFQAKGMLDSVEIEITQLVGAYDTTAKDMHDSQAVLNQIVNDFPLVGWFTNITNVYVSNAQDLAAALVDSIRDYLNAYLWKRIGWCAVFIVVSVLLVFLADKRSNVVETPSAARRDRRSSAASPRDGTRHTGRSVRRHRF